MVKKHYNRLKDIMETMSQEKIPPVKELMEIVWNLAMKIEQAEFLGADHYERAGTRRGYANGYKRKRLATPSGVLDLSVPKTANHGDTPFYPTVIERGQRCSENLQNAVVECFFQGVSTRGVGPIFACLGIESLSADQVSEAVKKLDAEFEAWRNRELGEYPYLVLDARYEKLRQNGKVTKVAVLSAIGIDQEGNRRILGLSMAQSEGEIHWKEFLQSLVDRGLSAVEYIVSDDHSGLKAARKAVFTHALWQRCQFHLTQNAKKQAPNKDIRESIAKDLRTVYDAQNLQQANNALKEIVDKYSTTAPKLALWLENNVPEALTVFSLPKNHREKMRTSNVIERAVNQQIKQRTRKIRVFPNEDSLLRIVTGIIIRINNAWIAKNCTYLPSKV